MFTLENTGGFTQDDCDLMNEALELLVATGMDKSNASDIINNNWRPEENSVESLTRTFDKEGNEYAVYKSRLCPKSYVEFRRSQELK